jgi:hypothetical protein
MPPAMSPEVVPAQPFMPPSAEEPGMESILPAPRRSASPCKGPKIQSPM